VESRFGSLHLADVLFQVAALQGYLLRNKSRPKEAVEEVAEWVIKEREMREKLKKEKEEREAKEKKEREEKERKEREEKAAKDKEDREKLAKLEAKLKQRAAPVVIGASTATSSTTSLTTDGSGTSTGADDDTEETTASEGEADKKDEKWVSVTSASTPAKTATTPAAS